ncbi:MAG: hypothetical protein ACRDZ3_23470 [Acidimicrobiia bacterium]
MLPVLHGCDGSEPTPKESQSDARGAEYFEQQAGAVSRALEDGRFGPRADVLVEMEAAAKEETIVDETTFEETVPRFFGRILPWNEMNEDQQDAFITWINGSERVQAAVGDEFTRILNDLKLERSAAD